MGITGQDILQALGSLGGSGLIALIAWVLLRGVVAQNQYIVDTMLRENRELQTFLRNHLGVVSQSLAETASALRGISERIEHLNSEALHRENEHEQRAIERHQTIVQDDRDLLASGVQAAKDHVEIRGILDRR